MTAAGLIFSNIHDATVPELTRRRTMASIPFGGRYRLVGFALSNMVNAGISKVGLITHNNYQSLLDHIGNGKDWDLARREGGIKLLPPFITAYDSSAAGRLYNTRLEALMSVMNFINRCNEEVLVLSDCDVICNIDLRKVMALHEARNADMTLITAKVDTASHQLDAHIQVPASDDRQCLVDIAEYSGQTGTVTIGTDIILVRHSFLQQILTDAAARGYRSFYQDVVARLIGKARIYTHLYDGFFARINSLESYFRCSMRLLSGDARENLFYRRSLPVLTKIRNSAPTRYAPGCLVKNSLVADGCVIEGEVEDSILFRGVHIGKGTKISRSILMQDTQVGEKVHLGCVITDKNVTIRNGHELCGHEAMPFYIDKGSMI